MHNENFFAETERTADIVFEVIDSYCEEGSPAEALLLQVAVCHSRDAHKVLNAAFTILAGILQRTAHDSGRTRTEVLAEWRQREAESVAQAKRLLFGGREN